MARDSFECAIQKIAPVCEHRRCRVIGHGVEHGDRIFYLWRPRRAAEDSANAEPGAAPDRGGE